MGNGRAPRATTSRVACAFAAAAVAVLGLTMGCALPWFAAGASADDSGLEVGIHQDLTWDGLPARRQAGIDAARDVLHAQLSRNSFLWNVMEPAPGVYDWSRTDAVLQQLEAAGIEPLFVVYGSPSWANGTDPSTRDAYVYVPTDETAFGRWLDAYATFMHEAARRYGSRVTKWELWNEPNQSSFWKPRPDVDRYARWYNAIHDAIRSEAPRAQIASGGLAGVVAGPVGDYDGVSFLRQLHERGVDPEIVAIHPYPTQNQAPDVHLQWENNFDDIGTVHDTLVSLGRNVPIWVTEWGWKTTKVSLEQQRAYVALSLEMLVTDFPYVRVATYFVDKDRLPQYPYGLLDEQYRPKPAAEAFAAFARRQRGDVAPPGPAETARATASTDGRAAAVPASPPGASAGVSPSVVDPGATDAEHTAVPSPPRPKAARVDQSGPADAPEATAEPGAASNDTPLDAGPRRHAPMSPAMWVPLTGAVVLLLLIARWPRRGTKRSVGCERLGAEPN